MQQSIHLTGPERLHALRHGFIQSDLHSRIQLLDSFCPRCKGVKHPYMKFVELRQVSISFGDKGKRRLYQVIRNNARLAGGAWNGAPERHNNIISLIIQGFFQSRFFNANK